MATVPPDELGRLQALAADLACQLSDVRARLADAEQTLAAIRGGEVDALVVTTDEGDQLFTLTTADHPYRVLVEEMPDAAATVNENGLLLYANRRLAELLGTPTELLVGTSLVARVAPSTRRAFTRLLTSVPGMRAEADVTMAAADGSPLVIRVAAGAVDIDGERMVCLVLTDLTERQRMEQTLRAGERRFHASLDVLLDGFMLLSAERDEHGGVVDLRVDYANPAACVAYGRAERELLGRGLCELRPAVRDSQGFRACVSVVESGVAVRTELSGADGVGADAAVYDARVACVGDGLVVAFRDITEQRRAHRELAETHRRLEQHAERLTYANAELAEFVYVVSHDLSEPLRTVEGFARLLIDGYKGVLDDTADEYLDYVESGVLRMRRLLDDLRSYSRLNTHGQPFRPVDLDEIAKDVLADLHGLLADNGAEVDVGPLPTVVGDRTQLTQVLQNLISNAVKFVEPGTRPSVSLGATRVEGGWRIDVSDNGIGIAPASRAKVFAMFVRLHGQAAYPGTGMGLAICRKVISRHGGDIWIDDRPGPGTTVSFLLPDDPADALAAARDE